MVTGWRDKGNVESELAETLKGELENKLKELGLSWNDLEAVAVCTEHDENPRLLTIKDAEKELGKIGGDDYWTKYEAFAAVNFQAWTKDYIFFPFEYESQYYTIVHLPRNPATNIERDVFTP